MDIDSLKRAARRRKEVILLVVAAVASALALVSSLSGWLDEETWGTPVTARRVTIADVPEIVPPDLGAIWSSDGRNPFGDAAVTLKSGGKARLPLPPVPPLTPDLPPAPVPRLVDLLSEDAE